VSANKKQFQLQKKCLKGVIVKILPLIAFIVPLALLYFLNPMDSLLKVSIQDSYQLMWKGRTFQLFFIWLIALEFILGWETIKSQITQQSKLRGTLYGVVLALPTICVILQNYFGLNASIAGWMQRSGIAFADSMPLAFEYIFFSLLLLLTVGLSFGKKGLASFALPALFAALVGVIYSIDNVFPYGSFTPFQMLVPITVGLATGVLGWMGNTAVAGTDPFTGMPTLDVSGSLGNAKFSIAWPCAGIEGFLIFTAVSLLFLKRIQVSWKAKIGFFAFGAVITYLINVLRIATIFSIAQVYGVESLQVQDFHFYYGPLYTMAWIVAYPIILIFGLGAWKKISTAKPCLISIFAFTAGKVPTSSATNGP
jgi:thaumarchaeosortase